MIEKIKLMLSSIRFWQVTGATGFAVASHYFPQFEFLWQALAAWLLAVAGIGTLDSVASRFAGTKTDPPVVPN